MPASVAVSSGLAANLSSLEAAQATTDAKSRPSVLITSGNTEYIEFTPTESGNALLSFVPTNTNGTYTVEVNDVDQGFVKTFPFGLDETDRRQGILLPVTAGQVIRLSIVATGGNVTIYPLLHLKPASGPWDAHVIFGASREGQGHESRDLETSILSVFTTRDPIVFNYGRGSYASAALAGIVDECAASYDGLARYAFVGSVMGNNVTAFRPWDSSQTAAITGHLTTMQTELEGAGMDVCFGSTSYRAYGDVSPGSPDNGSHPYNTNILFPYLTSNLPSAMNSALGRPNVDEYLLTMFYRDELADEVHGNTAQYGHVRDLLVDTWFRSIYTGAWTYTSQPETRVAAAEAEVGDEANLWAAYLEALYAVDHLAASSAKTAFQARLAAIYPEAQFYQAKVLITAAESSATQEDKDAAQAALTAADNAGYVDQASPNTIAEQQARIDAIVTSSFDQIVNVAFGGTGTLAGWNRTGTFSGTVSTDLNDSTDTATGIGLIIDNPFTGNSTNTGLVSEIPDIPDTVLSKIAYDTSGASPGAAMHFTGLNPAKTYDVIAMCTKSGAPVKTAFATIQGVDTAVIEQSYNVSEPFIRTGVSPDGSNEISISFTKGAGATTIYLASLQLKRHA